MTRYLVNTFCPPAENICYNNKATLEHGDQKDCKSNNHYVETTAIYMIAITVLVCLFCASLAKKWFANLPRDSNDMAAMLDDRNNKTH